MVHRLRRWTNVKPTLIQSLLCLTCSVAFVFSYNPLNLEKSQYYRNAPDEKLEICLCFQATKSLGMIVGSLLGGLVNDRFVEHTDVVMAAAAIMAGVVTVFKPLTSYLWVLAILYFLDGVGHASMNAGL